MLAVIAIDGIEGGEPQIGLMIFKKCALNVFTDNSGWIVRIRKIYFYACAIKPVEAIHWADPDKPFSVFVDEIIGLFTEPFIQWKFMEQKLAFLGIKCKGETKKNKEYPYDWNTHAVRYS